MARTGEDEGATAGARDDDEGFTAGARDDDDGVVDEGDTATEGDEDGFSDLSRGRSAPPIARSTSISNSDSVFS